MRKKWILLILPVIFLLAGAVMYFRSGTLRLGKEVADEVNSYP